MKPSVAFENNRALIRDAVARHKSANPRIFGSVLHGTDKDGSDVDILVDTLPETSLFDLGGLQVELEEALGVPVQVSTSGGLSKYFRDEVLAEARPV
ncbi:MAG: nucleotidyltransferase family protein [Devosia sp.]|nr:nucleotidyltransferase family protein [Devosia sp.]